MPPAIISHAELLELLYYDPETGVFTWRQNRRPKIRAGDEAGGIKGPWNYFYVTVKGRPYLGNRLAWFYVHGEWPEGHPRFIDGNTDNCAIGNLSFGAFDYSDDPKAVNARRYRERLKTGKKQRQNESPISDIARSATGGWHVHLPNTPFNFFAYETKTLEEATRLYLGHVEGLKTIERLPARYIEPADLETYAGDTTAICLAEAIGWLCYDPDSGRFYHRMRHTRTSEDSRYHAKDTHELIAGMRADRKNSAGTPVIKLFGRDYPAHMMAVFLQKGFWPARRKVLHIDGDKTNNKWTNIEVVQ